MTNTCPNCHASLDPDARFCPACSAPIIGDQTLVPETSVPNASQPNASLPNVSVPNMSAQSFAYQSSTQARVCPKCWTPLGANATFCGNCGTTIGRLSRKTKIIIAAAIIGLALIVGSIIYFSSGTSGSGLFPIVQNGKWGYMDKHGKVVINPQFDEAGLFSEGLATVRIGRKWGYINTKGEYAINPQFDYAAPFSEGLAAVFIGDKRENGKIGYIDKTGKMVTEPQFDVTHELEGWIDSFSDGLAPVEIGGKTGYIDKTGKVIISPQFDFALPFSDGLAVVVIDRKFGYIDKTGKVVINPQFDEAWSFTEGLGLIEIEGKWGYVDKTGKIIINPQFSEATPFSEEGIAGVRIGDKWGGINKTGTVVINPQFDGNIFSNGPVSVMAKQIIAGDVRRITFSEGLAEVEIDRKHGYIDKTGKFVINPQFDAAFPFNEGLAMVVIGGNIGYIDKTGKYIWNPIPPTKANSYNNNTTDTATTTNKDDQINSFINDLNSFTDGIVKSGDAAPNPSAAMNEAQRYLDDHKADMKSKFDSIKNISGNQISADTKKKFYDAVTANGTKVGEMATKYGTDPEAASKFQKLRQDYQDLFKM